MIDTDGFIDTLKSLSQYRRLIELRKMIVENPDYLRLYSEYQILKRESVKSAVYGHNNTFQKEAEEKLNLIMSDVILCEYVTLLEQLNELVQSVQEYINKSLQLDR